MTDVAVAMVVAALAIAAMIRIDTVDTSEITTADMTTVAATTAPATIVGMTVGIEKIADMKTVTSLEIPNVEDMNVVNVMITTVESDMEVVKIVTDMDSVPQAAMIEIDTTVKLTVVHQESGRQLLERPATGTRHLVPKPAMPTEVRNLNYLLEPQLANPATADPSAR